MALPAYCAGESSRVKGLRAARPGGVWRAGDRAVRIGPAVGRPAGAVRFEGGAADAEVGRAVAGGQAVQGAVRLRLHGPGCLQFSLTAASGARWSGVASGWAPRPARGRRPGGGRSPNPDGLGDLPRSPNGGGRQGFDSMDVGSGSAVQRAGAGNRPGR